MANQKRMVVVDGIEYVSITDVLKIDCNSSNPYRDLSRILKDSIFDAESYFKKHVFPTKDGRLTVPSLIIPIEILSEWKSCDSELFRIRQDGLGQHGFVYVIHFKEMPDCYKIGKAINIEKRIKSIENITPFTVLIDWQIQTASALILEGILHQKFKKKRIRNEWFSLTSLDIDEIKHMQGLLI